MTPHICIEQTTEQSTVNFAWDGKIRPCEDTETSLLSLVQFYAMSWSRVDIFVRCKDLILLQLKIDFRTIALLKLNIRPTFYSLKSEELSAISSLQSETCEKACLSLMCVSGIHVNPLVNDKRASNVESAKYSNWYKWTGLTVASDSKFKWFHYFVVFSAVQLTRGLKSLIFWVRWISTPTGLAPPKQWR